MERIELKSFDGVSEHLIAYVDQRCVDETVWCRDGVEVRGHAFDAPNGRLYFAALARTYNCSLYSERTWIGVFEGFATTFEVLQTFSPQAALGVRVPYMPEGLPAADSFDTYWGPLTKPIDFTQAHPLACDYPAAAPHVGDYLTVADPLPDPAPGTGYYYVTAATYHGQTRFGRKSTAGYLSGRDPALLPACVQP